MKRLTRDEVQVERMLRAVRSVAVLGASARPGHRSNAVVAYLKQAGFDVFPVRADRAEVAGLASWARLADIPGAIDLVLVLAAGITPATIEVAARKGARALWLAPGVPAVEAGELAAAHGLQLVRGRDVTVEHRHTEQVAGQPRKRGVGARTQADDQGRKPRARAGYAARGGGGRKGGGGRRAVLDEKKMVGEGPSPRRRRLRRPG
jgi:hypothetical protein